ncbi:MAG TPA: M23 family metallopeptidase [Chitinophagaceae bacterium]
MRTAMIFICVLKFASAFSQIFETPSYPKGYFRNPLSIPISLSGNFGELRSNHYHMGLDLRTNRVENLPVYAAAEGFISRIKIEPGGFGRAIYIDHPNGYTTLYAHLNNFFPALERYIKQKQYELESWNVQLDLPPGQFPVKKGDFLAYSGNSGGSQAPHLHFEIRRTGDDVNVNPLLFGLPLADNTSPNILRLAVYDRTKSLYEQSPRIVPVKKTGNNFTTSPSTIIVSTPKVSFSIGAFDTHSGSTNANGIFESILQLDGQPVVGFRMDNISYNDTRYLNAHIDYRTRSAGGPYLQHLSELPGYIPTIYKQVSGDGVVDLSDGEPHALNVIVRDAYGNASTLTTNIRYDGSPVKQPADAGGKLFYPLMLDAYEAENAEFFIGETSLYDSVHIRHIVSAPTAAGAVSESHTIGATYIPLQSPVTVRLRPFRSLSPEEKERVVMLRVSGTRKEVQKVEWNNDWASARFREFGVYQLVFDDEPPVIVPVGITDGANLSKATRIAFTIKDNNTSFKNFRAELDGQWLRFTNDKGRTFIYTFDEKCPAGDHELKVRVSDEAGNVTERVYRFRR